MGAAQSLMACCTNRDKEEFVLQSVDIARPEKDPSQQRALDAQAPRASLLPPSPPTITTQVDTPKVQDSRLTEAEASDKATEVGCASSLQALLETPRLRWIADNGAPRAICTEASNSDLPPPPRPGFRATVVEKEEQREVDVALTPNSKGVPNPPLAFLEEETGADAVLTPSSKGVPDPPLALPEDVAEATKVVEATDMSEIEAARAAHFVEERGWGFSSLSSCHQESPATSARIHGPAKTRGRSVTGPLQRDLPRWSVNSEDSLVAKLAERMHRQRAGRVPDDQ